MILFEEDSSLWEPRESEKFPGCYYPPFKTTSKILFTKDSKVIDEETGKERKVRWSSTGYRIIGIRNDNKYHVCQLHRTLAVLFVPKPERHKDKSYDELEVNHMDGDPSNNDIPNLEWVTHKENLDHARDVGLFSNDVPCYARDVVTDEVFQYRSLSVCARTHCISVSSLSSNVNSIAAGRVVTNGHVYMLNDGQWPTLLLYGGNECPVGKGSDVIARNLVTGNVLLASTFKGACDYLNLNFVNVRNSRNRKGYDVPYLGWIFESFEDYLEENPV